MSGWETGDTKSIDGDNLVSIARELHTTPEYIMSGKPPPSTDQLTSDEVEVVELFRELTTNEAREHFVGLLRAMHPDTRVDTPPLLDDQD